MRALEFNRRAGHLFHEILRFMVVGGAATLVSVIGYNALVHGMLLGTAPLGQRPISAYVLVNILGGCVAYLGMRLWAFSHREVSSHLSSVVNFFALGALTMAIPVLCLAVSRYVLGWSSPVADNISANVIGLALGTATRFWVFRRYVFLDVTQPVPEAPAA